MHKRSFTAGEGRCVRTPDHVYTANGMSRALVLGEDQGRLRNLLDCAGDIL
jgi:hypothetical protein